MKNIKILIALITMYSLGTLIHAIHFMFFQDSYNDGKKTLIFIGIVFLFLFTVGTIAYALFKFIKLGYFNSASVKYLKIGGILYFIYGLIVFIQAIFYSFFSQPQLMEKGDVFRHGFAVIVGFGIITIADILKRGATLKEENDLTI